jgi:malonyl-CoA O-methyltransferase
MHHTFIQSHKQDLHGVSSLPVIFLPGWGFDGRIVEFFESAPAWFSTTNFLDPKTLVGDLKQFLDGKKTDQAIVVGWSMGAHLALDFAHAYPEKVASLTLISIRKNWPANEIEAIRNDLLNDMPAFLKNFYRKCFLGYKSAYKKFAATLQRDYLKQTDTNLLVAGLTYLQKTECRPVEDVPTGLVHGTNDVIVPLDEMMHFPTATRKIIDHAGHLPLLSDPSVIAEIQKQKLSSAKTVERYSNKEKTAIRHRFSRAASSYDRHALLQKELAFELVQRAADLRSDHTSTKRILEIGCGTGSYTKLLCKQFPEAEVMGLDFSQQMIDEATNKLKNQPRLQLSCEDGEEFLTENAGKVHFDLITSNATLQWFLDLQNAFSRMARVMRPDGLLLASVFGSSTLTELGEGLRLIFGDKVAVAAQNFPDREMLQYVAEGGFSKVYVEHKKVKRQYAGSLDLLQQFKRTGTSGWRPDSRLILTRKHLKTLDHWFEKKYGRCEVTYEIFLITCWNPLK